MTGRVNRQSRHKDTVEAQVAAFNQPASAFPWPEIVEKMSDSEDQVRAEKYAAALHRARPGDQWLPHEITQVCDLARAMTQRDKASKQLDLEGQTIVSVTGQVKLHPAQTALQNFRSSISQGLRVLGLSGSKASQHDRPAPVTQAAHARQLNAAQPFSFAAGKPDVPIGKDGRPDYKKLRVQ